MPIEFREFLGARASIKESTTNNKSHGPVNLSENYSSAPKIAKGSIMQDIEGIHAGPTRNYTWYMESALKSSIPTWTKPYKRPLIMHHNEEDGTIIGRIHNAEMKYAGTRSGTPAIEFTCNVPDPEGIKQIKDGRLETTSIGVIAHDVRCSICHQQIELDVNGEPECGHMKGEVYDEEICYWQIYAMEAKELSYVIVPSDIYAHNTRTYEPEVISKSSKNIKESVDNNTNQGGEITMSKVAQQAKMGTSLTEGNIIQEEVNAGQAKTAEQAILDANVPQGTQVVEDAEKKPEADKSEDADAEAPAPAIEDGEAAQTDVDGDNQEPEADVTTENNDPELQARVEALEAQVNDLTAKLAAKEVEVQEEVALKEAAETKLVEQEVELRESMELVLNSYREKAGKSILAKEALSTRTVNSMRDTIIDLKEELSAGKAKALNISEASNPTLTNEKKVKDNVGKNKSIGNIELGESAIKDIFGLK